MDTKTINAAVKTNMEALKDILANAAELASEGHGYMLEDNRNGAIGTIADLDKMLEDAKALQAACLVLHKK